MRWLANPSWVAHRGGGLPETHAIPNAEGAGWLVTGHKTWTTGGKHLTHMLVSLRIEDEAGLMLILQDSPGIEWVETWSDSLSLRASDSHDVYFNSVPVPPEHVISRGKAKVGPPSPNFGFLC